MSKSFSKTDLNENDVRELLTYIPAPQKGTNSREYWLKIIAATCDALNGNETAALALLKEWSPEWEKNAYETALRSFGGNYKTSAATLVFFAKENGYNASEKARERAARERPAKRQNTAPKPATPESGKKAAPAPQSIEKTDTARSRVDLGKCSVCESPRKPETVKPCKLITCLKAIKGGKWRNEVSAVRAGTREKSTLPQVCAFGVYSDRRKDENLFTRSGFLVLDYDGKDNTGTDFSKLRSRLARLPFTLAVFASPSGNGLKALIRVPDSVNDGEAFSAAARVLAPLGGKIDAQSEARKHFIVSYDPAAFISETPIDEIPPLTDWENLPPAALAAIFAETVENFFFAGTEDYFFNDAGTIKKLSVSAAAQEFEVRYGANRKTARLALYAVRKSRYVHRVFPALTCHNAGFHVFDKKPALVLSSPEIIEADEGLFPTIENLIKTVFNAAEAEARFLAWLQHARRAFLRCADSNGAHVSPVPLLMLLGTAGAGKDLIFQTLIRPALGDRQHAPADAFPQEKPWLGSIIGAECVLASEMPNLTAQERSRFAQTIKQIVGGSGYNAESKGKDAFTFRGQHFLVLLANIDDGGNCAASCPDPNGDFREKTVALALRNSDAVKKAFPHANARQNAAEIRHELPAFLYWLETRFEPPAAWQDERFGVKGYFSPAAERALFEVSIDFDVLAKIEEIAETDKGGEVVEKPLAPAALGKIIAEKFYERTIPPRVLGVILKRLSKNHPETLKWNGSEKHSRYTVCRPRSAGEKPPSLNF